MSDPAEDDWGAIDARIGWGYSGPGTRETEANEDMRRAIAAVRAAEREKVRALVEKFAQVDPEGPLEESACLFCGGELQFEPPDWFYLDHAEGCPWVEARLWLDEEGQ